MSFSGSLLPSNPEGMDLNADILCHPFGVHILFSLFCYNHDIPT